MLTVHSGHITNSITRTPKFITGTWTRGTTPPLNLSRGLRPGLTLASTPDKLGSTLPFAMGRQMFSEHQPLLSAEGAQGRN
jgi:hypothetical protein